MSAENYAFSQVLSQKEKKRKENCKLEKKLMVLKGQAVFK